MYILQASLLSLYLLLTFSFFINWLKFFKKAPLSSVEDRFLSVIILVIATILWPFVIPINYLIMLKPQAVKQDDEYCQFKKVL